VNGSSAWRRAFVAAVLAAAAGCASKPSQANILLRKENQQLTGQVTDLKTANAGLTAQIEAIQAQSPATTQELPESRLDLLFTTHGLSFGSLTGGFSPDDGATDQMVKVYIVPTDDDGQPLKAAGAFKIELFDLAEQDTRLGTWNFSTEQARGDWFGHALLYTYEFDCSWQTPPRHADLLLRVTFTDELTGRQFKADRNITVQPPK
jgi:hypothetical protein